MTPNQLELMEKHGTPVQFESAVWEAFSQGFITHDEAIKGIEKYRREWEQAGKQRVA